jgi:Asp-tRNA(Asn)/Glu-tRNA(Gln) amidotransferase A subunit family amidase
MELTQKSAARIAAEICSGSITSEQVVEACLKRISLLEDTVQAWSFLDPDYALAQARSADRLQKEGKSLGSLHGVPVGVKDIIDTADMPTENGTVLHAGRQPTEDATVISLLRSAGAIILGKTVTTELAVYTPGKTRNPHNPEHTPGGSSSGSAAAVAAGMVPLAVGTQTNGSVIRPGSYCGVVAFKPTHGSISRYGVLRQSLHLDQMGVFARTVEDVALISEELMVFDSRDPSMKPFARPPLCRFTNQEPPTHCRIAFVKSPVWEQTEEDTRSAFADLVQNLGSYIEEVRLPAAFDEAVELHRIIMEADLSVSFSPEYDRGAAQLSRRLCKMIESGQEVLAVEYNRALAKVPALIACLEEIFKRYDAILTPSTTGEAPKGLQSTGSPIFCTLWTLCGVPTVNIPLLKGANGLPIGVQLVGRRHNEGHLLRTAKWVMDNWESEEKGDKN